MDRRDIKRVQLVEELRGAGGNCGEVTVRQVMTPAPTCIRGETTALELVKMFHVKEFRHLLVTDDSGHLVGIVSDRDVIRCFGPSNAPKKSVLESITAAQIMSTDLLTIPPDAPLARAVTLMLDHGVSCLPVLADQKLVGVLTSTDLQLTLEALLRLASPLPAEQSLHVGTS